MIPAPREPTLGMIRRGWATMIGALLVSCRAPSEGVVARSELLVVHASGPREQRTLRLDAAPGARINARLVPRLERRDAQPVAFGARMLTADSSYFAVSPSATIDVQRSRAGTLRASVCPASAQVCQTITIDVPLR